MSYVSGPISSFSDKIPSSTDIIPIVDLNAIDVRNKRAYVGNIFKAVPYSSGTDTPAISFGSTTSTGGSSGIFSINASQVGIRVNNTSNLNVEKTPGAITLNVSDTTTSDLSLTFRSHGSGTINFASSTLFTDNIFFIRSQTNQNNTIKFDLSNVQGSNTLSVPVGSGQIVTDIATQNLSNKNLINPLISGTLKVNDTDLVVVNDKVGIGIGTPDYNLHVLNDIKISGASPTIRVTGVDAEYQIINNQSNKLDFNLLNFGTILSLSGTGASATTFIANNINYGTQLNINGNGSNIGIFDANGNFGLGITPLQKLDVSGGARVSDGFYRPNGSLKAIDYDNSTTYHYSNQQFRAGTGSSLPNVIITSSGLVGIGKTVPTIPLDVSGRVRTDSILNASTIAQKVVSTSINSNVLNLDLDSGTVFTFTLFQNINTINYLSSKGTLDSDTHFTITLIISHDNNAYSVNWNPNAPTSYKILWVPSGGYGTGITASTIAPVLQTAGPGPNLVSSKDIITLTTYDSGNTFIGRYVAALPAS